MIYGLPRRVPGFRLVPLKIAASGARALLAMTNLVGLAGKRGSFRNEIFENWYEATPRKNDRIQQNASVFQTKTLQFCVIARPLCGRGNLKAKGMASRDEATPRKNDRIQQNASVFQTKTLQLCVIARPPCGRGNLKAEGMASRYEARKQEPTKFQNSDPSRRDTAIALHLGRYIIRPRGRISYAAAYIMQRSCISLRSPASPSPHCTCVSIFHLLEAQISPRSPAAPISGFRAR